MLAKLTSKNQLTLPKAVLEGLGSVEYFDAVRKGDEIVLKPVTVTSASAALERVRGNVKALGLTESVVSEAVRWSRKR